MPDPAHEPDQDLAGRLIARMVQRGLSLATCESLTGGLLGATLTAVPGASAVYRGGLITYATDLKHRLAGVSEQVLAADGAVARRTALGMAQGAAERCGADCGLALTGVAGPDRQEGKPAGTVWLGVVRPDAEPAAELLQMAPAVVTAGRPAIRAHAVDAAMRSLFALL